jgi:hypothetical protein
VLPHFDPAKPLCLKTDASGYAIAGMNSQQQDEAWSGAEGATWALKKSSLPARATSTRLSFGPGACHRRSVTTL